MLLNRGLELLSMRSALLMTLHFVVVIKFAAFPFIKDLNYSNCASYLKGDLNFGFFSKSVF